VTKQPTILALVALFMGATGRLWAQAGGVSAQSGDAELAFVISLFSSNYAILIGCGVLLWGIWKFAHSELGSGLILILVGVTLTLVPILYRGVHLVVCPVTQMLGYNINC
jgi:hypothetical protein